MHTARLIAAAAVLASGWALYAKPAPAPAGPSPAALVAVRQAGMDMSATTLNVLKGASANGAPVKNLTFAAAGLAKWAVAMPALFAANTSAAGVPTRAKPEIWADPAGFSAKAAALAEATRALAAAAAADDKDGFAAALASTGAACKGCHDVFQAPPPAKPAG